MATDAISDAGRATSRHGFAARRRGAALSYVSLFEVLRVGPGPSSTHTAGPYHAARRFVHELAAAGRLTHAARLGVELYGGAACGGRDNGAAGALVAGLESCELRQCDAVTLAARLAQASAAREVALGGRHKTAFDPAADIGFRIDRALAWDGNAVRFAAFDRAGAVLADRVYLTPGDDRVLAPGEPPGPAPRVPYECASADDLIQHCRKSGRKIAVLALANETALRGPAEVRSRLGVLHEAMREAVSRGLDAGVSPGVHRRARIAPDRAVRLADAATPAHERCAILALAAAERNAAGASVVAAPSNGAGGTVAGVLVHALDAQPESADARAVDFLATAGAVGALLRAQGLRQVGCQGEIGVASAMAAAGYTAVLGGTPHQILHAAETALKAHLGLGCDPHNGRIETPCIDRCETAAARACTAALAAVRVPSPPIAFDRVAASMIESGRALAGRFKQASLGGIALSVPDC